MSTADSGRPRVGVIGLGAMGAGMAASLRRAGFALCVHDVRASLHARLPPLPSCRPLPPRSSATPA